MEKIYILILKYIFYSVFILFFVFYFLFYFVFIHFRNFIIYFIIPIIFYHSGDEDRTKIFLFFLASSGAVE